MVILGKGRIKSEKFPRVLFTKQSCECPPDKNTDGKGWREETEINFAILSRSAPNWTNQYGRLIILLSSLPRHN